MRVSSSCSKAPFLATARTLNDVLSYLCLCLLSLARPERLCPFLYHSRAPIFGLFGPGSACGSNL